MNSLISKNGNMHISIIINKINKGVPKKER